MSFPSKFIDVFAFGDFLIDVCSMRKRRAAQFGVGVSRFCCVRPVLDLFREHVCPGCMICLIDKQVLMIRVGLWRTCLDYSK